jgi:hypothetical protein
VLFGCANLAKDFVLLCVLHVSPFHEADLVAALRERKSYDSDD